MRPASAWGDVIGATQVAPTVAKIPHVPGTTETFKKKGDIKQNIKNHTQRANDDLPKANRSQLRRMNAVLNCRCRDVYL